MKKIFILLILSITITGIFYLLGCSTNTIPGVYSTGTITGGELFDFSAGGDSTNGDISSIGLCTASIPPICVVVLNDHNGNSPSMKDYGKVGLSSITSVNVSEISPNMCTMIYDHCYIIKTKEGNYAKFRVTTTPNADVTLNVDIEYYYQSDGSTTFSK